MIDLKALAAGMPAVTPEWGGAMVQASAVCLRDRGHYSGVSTRVDGSFTAVLAVRFPRTSAQIRRTWADADEATEFGACAVAIVAMRTLTGFTVVNRSWKGTGFDYWLGDESDPLFQGKARLEVSGIRQGDASQVAARTKVKLAQIARSSASFPGYVVIVEFGAPCIRITKTG